MSSEYLHPSVLVVGASGFVGLGVAKEFRSAGYFVYGLIRDEKKAPLLRTNEIIPVCYRDATKLEDYIHYIKNASIVIDCTVTFGDADPAAVPLSILKATEEASRTRDLLQPPKTYIYTSGLYVYGHDERVRDESWPIADNEYTRWRRRVEEATINSSLLNGVVLRPGRVFGRGGGHMDQFQNYDKLVINGIHKNRRMSCIHIDDLSKAYVAAAQKITQAKGRIFNIVNGYDHPLYSEVALKSAQLAGYKGEVHWEPRTHWTHEVVDATVVLSPSFAINILGWSPKIFGFLDQLEFYYESHKAAIETTGIHTIAVLDRKNN